MRPVCNTQAGIILVVVMIFGCAIYLYGCDSTKPTEPPPPEPREYLAYFFDHDDPRKFYSLNPQNGQLDTLPINVVPNSRMATSPDGKLLYVTASSSVAVVNLKTYETVAELPYGGIHDVVLSADGRWVAVFGDGVRILRTTDYSEVFVDTISSGSGSFSVDGDRFYYSPKLDGRYSARVVEVETGIELHSKLFSYGTRYLNLWRIKPSEDESRWFMYMWIGTYDFAFAVYDHTQDSIVFIDRITPGQGNMEITSDDKYAFYTSPGGPMFTSPPAYCIYVYDIASMSLDSISTVFYPDSTQPEYHVANDLCLTPDGKYLVGMERTGFDQAMIINIDSLQIERIVEIDTESYLSGLTCQTQP